MIRTRRPLDRSRMTGLRLMRTNTVGVTALAMIVIAFLTSIAPAHGRDFAWQRSEPEARGMDTAKLKAMQESLVRHGTAALLVIRHDTIVWESYADGHGARKQHYLASLTKSLAGLSLTLAINDGRISADDPAHRFIPAWKDDPLRRRITIRQLATYSSGIEDATVPGSTKLLDNLGGWKGEFWRGRSLGNVGVVDAERNPFTIAIHEAPLVAEPGTAFVYSNPGMAALAYAVTAAIRGSRHEDVRALLRERIMRPIGVTDSQWNIGYGRTFLVDGLPVVAWGGGGFTARALARIGRLLMRKGNWQGEQLIDARWVEQALAYAGTPPPVRPPGHPNPLPAMVWYNNSDGVWDGVPRDAFCGGGSGNQHLLVVPSLGLIVVRNGASMGLEREGQVLWGEAYRYLFRPVVAAVTD